ncbi:MAG: hypothetical protein Q9220_007293 [cf. Caloplaca sp. 1 TL-2023]
MPGINIPQSHDGSTDYTSDHDGLSLTGTTKFPPLDNVKTIFITGGAGFMSVSALFAMKSILPSGSWVTRHLTVRYPEYHIICYDKLDEVSSLANIRCLETLPNFHFHQGDLNDTVALSRLFADYDVDCVMHFAACSHVQNSFDDPCSFTLNNVVGTQRLLDAVRRHGRIKRFIHVSTDEVYGEAMEESVDETKQFMPTNPYSASKAAAEMYVWAYAKSFNIPALVVRSNNVYGPCQYPEKIIPRFYTLLLHHKPLTIQGAGLHIRRYLHAADAANGFDTLLHLGSVGESYNLNSSSAISNLELAVRMLSLFGLDPETEFQDSIKWVQDRPFNDHDYFVKGEKMEKLGWRQEVGFEEGLRGTVEWYRGHMGTWWPEFTEGVSAVGGRVGGGADGSGGESGAVGGASTVAGGGAGAFGDGGAGGGDGDIGGCDCCGSGGATAASRGHWGGTQGHYSCKGEWVSGSGVMNAERLLHQPQDGRGEKEEGGYGKDERDGYGNGKGLERGSSGESSGDSGVEMSGGEMSTGASSPVVVSPAG